MDDDRDGIRTVNGRVEPYNSSFSYEVYKGALVPVVWNLGSVFCGHCRKFKSLSLQAMHKHLESRHEEANKKHDMKVLRKSIYKPADADGVSGIIIHEKKIANNARTWYSDAEAAACSNGEAEASSGSSDEQSSARCTDDEAKDSSGSCDQKGAGSSDFEGKGSTNEIDCHNDIKEGVIEPDNTCFSYRIERGAIVPVVWHVGPAFCAYCPNFKSISLQAVYKHINSKHRKESDAHAHKVLLKTLDEPVDKDGTCATINHQKTNVLIGETKASDQGEEMKKKRKLGEVI